MQSRCHKNHYVKIRIIIQIILQQSDEASRGIQDSFAPTEEDSGAGRESEVMMWWLVFVIFQHLAQITRPGLANINLFLPSP